MENLTNVTATIVWSSVGVGVAVGVAYMFTGVLFIFLHIVCSCLIYTDKKMRNPTYQFMINLSIADCLELIPLAIYAGASLLVGEQNEILGVVMGFFVLLAWYANCVLFSFIAFSRWIAVTRNHLMSYVFRKRILICLHIIPWLVLAIFYFCMTILMYPMITFYFYPSIFTWEFTYPLALGKYLHWHNYVFNSLCATVEPTFNIMSLMWVHRTQKTIQSLEIMKNRKKETKLLIICTLIGAAFSATNIAFMIVWYANLTASPLACLILQAIWMFSHCVNPLVYLRFNSRLRKRFLSWISCKCKNQNQVGVDVGVSENPLAGGTKLVVVSISPKHIQ